MGGGGGVTTVSPLLKREQTDGEEAGGWVGWVRACLYLWDHTGGCTSRQAGGWTSRSRAALSPLRAVSGRAARLGGRECPLVVREGDRLGVRKAQLDK